MPSVHAQVNPGFGTTPAVASNPANGINNIPMSNPSGELNQDDTFRDEVLVTLRDIAQAPSSEAQNYKHLIQDYIGRAQNPTIKGQLQTLLQSLSMTQNPAQQTMDPSTGEKDPPAATLADNLVKEINKMKELANRAQSQPGAATAMFNLRAWREAAKAPAQEQGKPKDHKRGNPFKVLMGKIQKLLDKGANKHDIVRFLSKEGIWEEKMINRAVDVVKDYNKKAHRKNKSDDKPKGDASKTEKKPDSKATFNLRAYRMSSDSKIGETYVESDDILDMTPDYEKRSTGELMARAGWLESLQSLTKTTAQGDGKEAADKNGVSADLKLIKVALKARGFDEAELKQSSK